MEDTIITWKRTGQRARSCTWWGSRPLSSLAFGSLAFSSLAGAAWIALASEPGLAAMTPVQLGQRSTAVGPAADAGGIAPAPCLQVGVAVGSMPLFSDLDYASVLEDWQLLTSFTVETYHKFRFIRFGPGSGDYDFSVADQLIQEMRAYGYGRQGMAFHTLFWHNRFQLDPWVETLGFQGTRDVIREHIDAVHQHYFTGPNAIPVNRVDLINEAISDTTRRLREPGPSGDDNPWAQAGTAAEGYVDWAVYAVQEAQSTFPAGTKLFYNDYGIEVGPIDPNPAHAYDPTGATHLSKADAVYKLIRDHLKPAGLDGLGIQTHLILPHYQNVSALRGMIQLYEAIGVEVHITELDVAIDTGGVAPTAAQLQTQAAVYAHVFQVAAEEPNCTQLTIWGVTDRHSWIPTFADHCPGCVDPLPHDDLGMPKPAYAAIYQVLATTLRHCRR